MCFRKGVGSQKPTPYYLHTSCDGYTTLLSFRLLRKPDPCRSAEADTKLHLVKIHPLCVYPVGKNYGVLRVTIRALATRRSPWWSKSLLSEGWFTTCSSFSFPSTNIVEEPPPSRLRASLAPNQRTIF